MKVLDKFTGYLESGGMFALAARIGLGSLLGVFTGSTILGFISQYGLFYFAFHHGARIPVEGLDVLSPAVTLFSFLLSITVVILILLSYGAAKLARNIYARLLAKIKPGKVNENEELLTLIMSVIGSIASAGGTIIALTAFVFNKEVSHILAIGIGVIVFLFSLFLLLAAVQSFLKYFVLFSGLTVVMTSMFFVLQPDNFASFLRESRFGGEVGVEINYVHDIKKENTIKGKLFLRSSSALYVYDNDGSGDLVEIPLGTVSSIVYKDKFVVPEALYR